MKQNILVTNDDGINAKGLRTLIQVASHFGKVTVVAPESSMSGMSHSVTLSNPLYLRRIKKSDAIDVYACQGTPVDCIKIAMDYIMEEPPTLVLSGINHGANTNMSVIYSGTMGAATEGAICGVPSIGFSMIDHNTKAPMDGAAKYCKMVIEDLLAKNNKPNICLNVNIPSIPEEQIKGIRLCRHAMGFWRESFEKQTNSRGLDYYWLTGEFVDENPDATDTDEWAIKNGYVSVVPVSVDMTDYKQIEAMKSWGY